ncbi:MAG: TetR/AcrR family transcriptional regulator [Myxococcales bacterium]|nr:TetR/AcrR family transcriptional regulator [Myxococcales bacterium]
MVLAIKAAARNQIRERGAAALSLGAIARALNVTTPALYRYFDGRDALVTSLVADAYEELGQTLEAAAESAPAALDQRFVALARAYRKWACASPQEYILIHGAIFPGYRAPIEVVAAAALRSLHLFVDLLERAESLGKLRVPRAYSNPEAVARLGPIARTLPIPMVATAYATWLSLHGLVWEELLGRLPGGLGDDGALYELEAAAIAERLGLVD